MGGGEDSTDASTTGSGSATRLGMEERRGEQGGSRGKGELEITCAWGADDCPFHFVLTAEPENQTGWDPQLTLDTHTRTHTTRGVYQNTGRGRGRKKKERLMAGA